MKTMLPVAALAVFVALPLTHAQSEDPEICADCLAREQIIADLRAEIETLKAPATDIFEPADAAQIPTLEPVVEAPVAPPAATKTYTVVAGDGLMKIARKTGCKASDIAELNGLTLDSVIRIGQTLKLPAAQGSAQVATPPAPAPVAERPKTYKIKEGETYYSISRRLKIPLDELMAANPKAKATQLYTGRVINLPPASPSPAADTPDSDSGATSEAEPEANVGAATDETEPATQPQLEAEKKILAIKVEQEISYGDFASQHGTDIERLNSLNDLNLTSATILAKGSELYVPAQP